MSREPEREEPRVIGLLLAAGAATRFGSPKQLAELDGRPLVAHALGRMLCVPHLHEVFVVVGAYGDEVAAAVRRTPSERVRIVSCPDWEEGMAASLRAGVAAADAAGAAAVLVHLADLPRVTPRVISLVLERAFERDGGARAGATRATYAGRPGHPVVLPRALFAAVSGLRGDTGARDLLAGPETACFEVGHLADPTDVDTPAILESLR